MKTNKKNIIEVEPETIIQISDIQAEELEGGKVSCLITTCGGTKTREVYK
jgi:hypothetical protein